MSVPLRVIVVDDEPLAIDRLCALLARIDTVEPVGTALSGPDAVALAARQAPDACLLDIGMPEMDGIAVARALAGLPTPPKIVFVTAYDRFAVAAFDVEAVDYLVKPVDPARLARALDRVRSHAAPAGGDRGAYLGEFWVPDRHGLTRVAAADVERITAERDYVRLHVGDRSWLLDESMARLEAGLDPGRFVRLHRSAIVRRDRVAGLRHDGHGWIARLADGSEQKVGRLFAANARKLAGRDR